MRWNGTTALWAGLGVFAYLAFRDQARGQAAAAQASAPVAVSADTTIIKEDKTGEALQKLINQLDQNTIGAVDPRYVNFQVDLPELQLFYKSRPYTRTIYDPRKKAWVPFEP